MYKQHMVGKGWYLLGAGSESDILRLVTLMRDEFTKIEKIDDTNITSVIRAALNARKREKIEEFVQGRYAIPYKELLNIGIEKLPSEDFREAILLVGSITLKCSCIICGFIDGFPTIVETTEKSTAHIREDFAVAGEGGYVAQAALLQREQSSTHNLATTIYQVYEAKRYAEKISSVGENTSLNIMNNKGKEWRVADKAGATLERAYAKLHPALPKNALKGLVASLELG